MKKVVLTALLFLSACSSPPEPPQVDWKQDPATMNSQLMDWQPTFTVIKSDQVNSSWVKLIRNFSPENRLYSDDVFLLSRILILLLLKVVVVMIFSQQRTGCGLTVHMG